MLPIIVAGAALFGITHTISKKKAEEKFINTAISDKEGNTPLYEAFRRGAAEINKEMEEGTYEGNDKDLDLYFDKKGSRYYTKEEYEKIYGFDPDETEMVRKI